MSDATTTELPAIERTLELDASPERVWRAISDPDELARWFP
ncbi:MAG: SRPBCC domain-containing protein [Chloroflexi bacterium]|nr:SRPBCC domain-containing protein [Chloroflexota bacterium]